MGTTSKLVRDLAAISRNLAASSRNLADMVAAHQVTAAAAKQLRRLWNGERGGDSCVCGMVQGME